MLDINFTPFPNFATERLYLRAIKDEDRKEVFELRSDPHIMKHINRPLAKSIEEVESFIKKITAGISKNQLVYWAITLKINDTLIGTICLWNLSPENHRAELGYELMPMYQGQGLMQEAFTRVVDYAFNSLKLHSLEANVNPGNQKSIKLLERNNFIQEAYFRENVFFEGKFYDTAIYSKINPDRSV